MKNDKKVTLDQLEAALTRAKEATPGGTPVDDTATDEEVNEMLNRVFGKKDDAETGEGSGE